MEYLAIKYWRYRYKVYIENTSYDTANKIHLNVQINKYSKYATITKIFAIENLLKIPYYSMLHNARNY